MLSTERPFVLLMPDTCAGVPSGFSFSLSFLLFFIIFFWGGGGVVVVVVVRSAEDRRGFLVLLGGEFEHGWSRIAGAGRRTAGTR